MTDHLQAAKEKLLAPAGLSENELEGAAAALDRGEDAARLARLASDQTARIALQVADGAVQVFGGHGYIRDYLPELHLRNVAGLTSFEALTLG